MDLLSSFPSSIFIIIFVLFHILTGGLGATFTFVNNCDHTVWPGILSGSGSPKLDSTGFQLSKATTRAFQAPAGWSGRFWARTGCYFDRSGSGSCATGDCGTGQMECNGAGAAPPATLAEFTLAGAGGMDFYDVSLVDGYNLPMVVEAAGGSGMCAATGCVTDLNRRCPAELRVSGGGACRSACEAFGTPEYCCSGEYGNPNTCKPTTYSQLFKSACPRSYSYAFDDLTSTFTCTGADYRITFCPSIPNRSLHSPLLSSPLLVVTFVFPNSSKVALERISRNIFFFFTTVRIRSLHRQAKRHRETQQREAKEMMMTTMAGRVPRDHHHNHKAQRCWQILHG